MKHYKKLRLQRNMNREIDFGREVLLDRSAEGREEFLSREQ
jgi:hypothetical protein